MSNSDSKFMQDEELRNLLNKWSAPEAPGSLDQRIAAAYQQATISMNEHLSSVIDPQRDSEVVKMKFCKTCQEEFADRFSFCPVDGTPLSTAPIQSLSPAAEDIETTYPVREPEIPLLTPNQVPAPIIQPTKIKPAGAPVHASAVTPDENAGEFHLTFLEDTG